MTATEPRQEAAAITPVTPEQLAEARSTLGQKLADRRRAAGLIQDQLAKLSGYSRSAIANVETGRSAQPRTAWARYDQILAADGSLLAGYDHYTTLTQQHHRHAAQERERQRTTRLGRWWSATEPARPDTRSGPYLEDVAASVRGGHPAGSVVPATIVREAPSGRWTTARS